MEQLSYADHVELLAKDDPALAGQVAGLTSVRHVIDWMQASGLSLAAFDLIAQDEFCHDGLLPLADGRHLSFGMT